MRKTDKARKLKEKKTENMLAVSLKTIMICKNAFVTMYHWARMQQLFTQDVCRKIGVC